MTVCTSLTEGVRRRAPAARVFQIEDPPLVAAPVPRHAPEAAALAASLGLDGRPVALYSGNFEPYQGVELLVDAAALAPGVQFVFMGGEPAQIDRLRARAARGARCVFAGKRATDELPAFLGIAAVVVSPRVSGVNTPFKIYTYLASGRPLVATRAVTHTQLLDDTSAWLVEPTPEGLAGGHPGRDRGPGGGGAARGARARAGRARVQRAAATRRRSRPRTPASRRTPVSALPAAIGRYAIEAEVGRGTMGVVYRARDTVLQRTVALKTIGGFALAAPDMSAFERRFLNEARVAAALSHPHIVAVHDFGRDEATGTLFIALEFLEGETLRAGRAARPPRVDGGLPDRGRGGARRCTPPTPAASSTAT